MGKAFTGTYKGQPVMGITPHLFNAAIVAAEHRIGESIYFDHRTKQVKATSLRVAKAMRDLALKANVSFEDFVLACEKMNASMTIPPATPSPVVLNKNGSVAEQPQDLLAETPETLAFLVATLRTRCAELESESETMGMYLKDAQEVMNRLTKENNELERRLKIEHRVEAVIGPPPAQKPLVKGLLGLYIMLGVFSLIVLARLIFDMVKLWQ